MSLRNKELKSWSHYLTWFWQKAIGNWDPGVEIHVTTGFDALPHWENQGSIFSIPSHDFINWCFNQDAWREIVSAIRNYFYFARLATCLQLFLIDTNRYKASINETRLKTSDVLQHDVDVYVYICTSAASLRIRRIRKLPLQGRLQRKIRPIARLTL